LGIAVEQFAHQTYAEKAGCAGDENQFVVVHAGADLGLRITRRPANEDVEDAGYEKNYS
jgi:hypothetical protein